MNSISYTITGDKLVIEVDVSKQALAQARPSSTGKSRIVAGTGGYLRVSDQLQLSLNVITK